MLVNSYSKKIFNLAYQFAGNFEEAEDLTQDIFIKLHNSLSRYDFEKNFTAWFLTLAKNHLIDNYRRTKWEKKNRDDYEKHFSRPGTDDSPENGLDREANRKLVWESLNLLSPEVRMTVILRDLQGKSYEEIAASLELPLGTVKSRVNRGRLHLARSLQGKQGELS